MTQPSARVLEIHAVHKSYAAVAAVAGVTFSVGAGEVVGLAGPNGSGKSTLARIAAGFARPNSGTTEICGIASGVWRERHGVGYVAEDSACGWPNATGVELLLLAGYRPDGAAASAIRDALGVGSLLERRTGALSKGQWRLIQCFYALVRQSRLIVMDEPDSGLDPAAMARLRTAVGLCTQAGCAVLILSHHLDELAMLAGRVLFMRRGRVVCASAPGDTPARLRQLYADEVGDE